MREFLFLTAACVVSYLIGGLNSAIIMSKLIHHEDIREKGSGNPGFTNYKRVYGNLPESIVVMVLDIGKTVLVVWLSKRIAGSAIGDPALAAAFSGLFAMLGHCYPVWYGFKGGKAFLAGMTSVFFVDWRVGLISVGFFLLILFVFHYMSLASYASMLLYPVALAIVDRPRLPLFLLSVASALLVLWRHKANVARLFKGEEKKFYFLKKKED